MQILKKLRPDVPIVDVRPVVFNFEGPLGRMTFVRVVYRDWRDKCDDLGDDWKTSYHGTKAPVALNIIHENQFRPAEKMGASQTKGLFGHRRWVFSLWRVLLSTPRRSGNHGTVHYWRSRSTLSKNARKKGGTSLRMTK